MNDFSRFVQSVIILFSPRLSANPPFDSGNYSMNPLLFVVLKGISEFFLPNTFDIWLWIHILSTGCSSLILCNLLYLCLRLSDRNSSFCCMIRLSLKWFILFICSASFFFLYNTSSMANFTACSILNPDFLSGLGPSAFYLALFS